MTTEPTTDALMWQRFTGPDGITHDADSSSAALALVIDGYGDDLDRDDAFLARLDHARHVVEELQARVLIGADVDAETFDVLTADKRSPVEAGVWDHDLPLFVVAVDYFPYSDTTAPTGNVVLLDPSDEYAYMESLLGSGYLTGPDHA